MAKPMGNLGEQGSLRKLGRAFWRSGSAGAPGADRKLEGRLLAVALDDDLDLVAGLVGGDGGHVGVDPELGDTDGQGEGANGGAEGREDAPGARTELIALKHGYSGRSMLAQSLTAPHGDAATSYPGTCRGRPDDPERRATTPHSWRLDSAKALALAGLPSWSEASLRIDCEPGQIGDAILARKDAPASYHLACVVDDAASGVTLVVRGGDLRPSTPIQRLLQILLGLPEPRYLHHALVLHEDGRRLAKRDLAPTLEAMRAAGVDGRALSAELTLGRVPSGFRLGEA